MTPVTSMPPPMKALPAGIVYPDRDGKPMSDNTRQFRWMQLLFGNLSAQFASRDDVFIAGDLLWYAVEGSVEERMAPDVMVVFGRPKGDRGSYKQWEEKFIPVTVAFEILSPGNSYPEMVKKFDFYDDHAVEEYYIYDPDHNQLEIYTRGEQTLRRIRDIKNFVSPRLGIRFEMTSPEMTVYGPDGRPFITFEELNARNVAQQRRADEQQRRADEQQRRADEQQHRADELNLLVEAARQRSARVIELGRKARQGQATPEELAELERLEGSPG